VALGDHVTWLPRRLVRVLRARIARVNAALESVSARHQVPLASLPAQAPVPAEPLWHVDRIHPGPAGHRLLASGALRAVAPLGLVAATHVPAVTVAPPGAASQMGWLVRNGAPWLVKRSVDLAPALGRQLLSA
jgi:phospholipase/lecithinase/hemolysin